MCGIFGYIGKRNAVNLALEGLKRLEYRGYDSAGLAGIDQNGKIDFCKEVGRIAVLENVVLQRALKLKSVISQTRWATHGEVSQVNAHPHLDSQQSLAIVHNGIIENFEELKQSLIKKGIKFLSQTDTEVVAHLIASFYKGDILKAVQKAVELLKGSYAVALIHRDFPDQIIAFANEVPLAIGIGTGEAFISSDPNVFATDTFQVVYLAHGEIAVVKAENQHFYHADQEIKKESIVLDQETSAISKGTFDTYTLKEIFEQPSTIRNALYGRLLPDYGTAFFEELDEKQLDLSKVERILILGCGTSWNAGYVASYMLEDIARIPTQVGISSEFRYKNPIISPQTLVIALSQSGETADTLAAIRESKAKGAKILAICNVVGSTIAREADCTIYLKAGPEIGVCSTKAFTSQMVVLSLLTLLLARMRHLSKEEGQKFLNHLLDLPTQVDLVLNRAEEIKKIAKKYAHFENMFYLGRHYLYPTALEGALKLKEISYINANGYPAGEMKHGPIALINEECPTVALCANKLTYVKLISNLLEVKARKGLIIAIAEEHEVDELEKIVNDVIKIPRVIDELAPILTTVAAQLFAYFIAEERGTDVDHPRNLAKSVTVE